MKKKTKQNLSKIFSIFIAIIMLAGMIIPIIFAILGVI